jgi:hypothetical protein
MKNIQIFIFAFLISSECFSQANNWADIEKIFNKTGDIKEGGFKITFPRSDLKVKVRDFPAKSGLALSSWIGFMKTEQHVMVMGDLVLLDKEVNLVIPKLIDENFEITALHNHLIGESPGIKYLHFSGKGDAVKLAESLKKVLAVTATPLKEHEKKENTPDWAKVKVILGNTGKEEGKLMKYNFERNETLTDNKVPIPSYMGTATSINFQMEEGEAGITGDFVLLAKEVNPVIKALNEYDIIITAIHNHMLYDSPHLFMLHFWAVDDPQKLAKGLKAALDKTNSKKPE